MTREIKKYCCSSDPRYELTLAAFLDIGIHFTILILTSVFVVIHNTNPESLGQPDKPDNEKGDFARFLKLERFHKRFILTVIYCLSGSRLILCLVQLCGARSKNTDVLKAWFLIGTIYFVAVSFFIFQLMYFTAEKIIVSAIGVLYIGFQLYTLWILTLLIKELTPLFSHPDSDEKVKVSDSASNPLDAVNDNDDTSNPQGQIVENEIGNERY